MTAVRFEITDAPAGAGSRLGIVRVVLRRARSKLPLALLLIATIDMSNRIDHLWQTSMGSFSLRIMADLWKINLLRETLFVSCIMLAVLAADEAVSRGARRWTSYALAIVAGAAVGAIAQWRVIAWTGWVGVVGVPEIVSRIRPLQLFFYALLYATLATFVYVNHRTSKLAAQRMRAAELARAVARRRTLESRLQAMQARVEPQFLFNTLGRVRELYELDPPAAGRVLDDLIAYLRAALPHLRESTSTLGREIELARAYLGIAEARLQDGLALEIEVSGALEGSRVPAMMLLPLIDHALAQRQGAGAPGGPIRIEGTAREARLRIVIATRGPAFLPAQAGGRAGPSGVADRLRAIYGDAARLGFEPANPGGSRAIVEIPHEETELRDR